MGDVDGWRAWYTDDRQYNSTTDEWGDLPDDGLLILRIYYDEYSGDTVQHTLTLDGDDYYFHVPGTDIYGCNNDPPEETRERYPGAIIKRGKWTTAEEFYATKKRAHHTTAP